MEQFNDFNSRRLRLAQFMCSQVGLSWGGLKTDDRDAFIDAAGGAIKTLESALASNAAEGSGACAAPDILAALADSLGIIGALQSGLPLNDGAVSEYLVKVGTILAKLES